MEIGDITDIDDKRGLELINKKYVEKVGVETNRIPIFLSNPRPHLQIQTVFINNMKKDLLSKTNLEPRTLGVTDFYHEAPLKAISKIMSECYGLLMVALKQTWITDGEFRANSNNGLLSSKIENKWITSPFCHVEPAMALQINLPIFVLREKDVIQDGVIDNGVLGAYIPEINISSSVTTYFKESEWNQLLNKWTTEVQSFYEKNQ
jgi:hypothetical protein